MRLVKATEMQEIDRLAIRELGIPGVVLMENAARGAARIFLDHFRPPRGSRVIVLCGPGNNGGDGYVMARYLKEAGLKPTVLVLAPEGKISGDALTNLNIIKELGLEIHHVPGQEQWSENQHFIKRSDYVIDGIFGTGLSSRVRGFYRDVIEKVNSVEAPVMSIDIPSGLDADSGQVLGSAIRAALTVTFGFPKLGQVIFPGVDHVGRLVRVDIGIPGPVADRIPARYRMTEPSCFVEFLRIRRKDMHKGNRGHLLVLAGSTGKTGAATMTCLGALRAGAGLVTLGIPGSLNAILESKLTEAMTFPLPETPDGCLSLEAEDEVIRLMEGKSALAIGPGLSTNQETSELVSRIIKACRIPVVIDADGVNALSKDSQVLATCRGKAVLTPHPGEMGRLIGKSAAEIQADRVGTALDYARSSGCFLVLKGARTLIANPEGRLYVNPTGNPALSSGGSGDVLTGLIAGFLARGVPIMESAVAGVYIHGVAADLLAEDMGESGILAGELLDAVPFVMASLVQGEWPLQGPPPHADFYQDL
ncbi:MAG: NAD(P)H-hydrate dehydratase [Deltaproteobacteria bacterium]|nr:NAD(P)H-hydrate dehydratase [Deltaproteobacteria bacterium]